VTGLRNILLRHRLFAAWLLAFALAMKLVVPGGYMIAVSSGAITIELCSGYGPQKMVAAMPGMTHHPAEPDDRAKAEMPCAFAGLFAASLAAADPLLLAAAIAFITLTVFRLSIGPTHPDVPTWLRPPLRGPPPHA
jgi:hypothetical protein